MLVLQSHSNKFIFPLVGERMAVCISKISSLIKELLEVNPQIFFLTRSLPRVLKCLKNRPYSWSVRSFVSPGRTGTEMSSFFLLFLHNLSRTQKKVGI
uniref:Uncharacterized protein n=1 Tax=Ursus americanus TaxID=9643 RepID=A0A452QDU9_URSAM